MSSLHTQGNYFPARYSSEPPYISFLKEVCNNLVNELQRSEIDGHISWEVKQLHNTFTCVELRYIDNHEPDNVSVFQFYAVPRYFNKFEEPRNMIKFKRMDSEATFVVEANPAVLLAIVTF